MQPVRELSESLQDGYPRNILIVIAIMEVGRTRMLTETLLT